MYVGLINVVQQCFQVTVSFNSWRTASIRDVLNKLTLRHFDATFRILSNVIFTDTSLQHLYLHCTKHP